MSKTVFLTGAAGFIGSHTAKELLKRGDRVIGVDDFNDYYDVNIKESRVADILDHPNFTLYRADIVDKAEMKAIFEKESITNICHLAARAGVRYSLLHPDLYVQTNVVGTMNLLELAKDFGVKHFTMASSSSVYGGNKKVPFSESDPVDHPISPYAATKRATELLGHTYHHLYGLNVSCLRFFTVYGPAGRPDMALFKFTKAILEGKPIDVYNHGKMKRDFTYVDDIVQGILGAIDGDWGYEIFNLGNSNTEELEHFINVLEDALGMKAEKNYMEMQPGDAPMTYADISKARSMLGFDPKIGIEEGIPRFVQWYKSYYNV